MKLSRITVCGVFGTCVCWGCFADIFDRPQGFKIGERLTLRPYVAMSLTYDSNVRSRHDSEGDGLWTISPTCNLSYNADSWSLLLSGFYNWRQYFKKEFRDEYDRHEYGEDLRWNWANSTGAEKGWSLILGQSFHQITMADDLVYADGSTYNGDSRQFQLAGALQRRLNERWHGDVNGSYYWLDYLNETRSSNAFYGWDRWTVGTEVGFAPSKWTDILLSGSYQDYTQDNLDSYSGLSTGGYSNKSQGWTVQGGVGSYMTERISYRLLVGWSRFDYGEGLMTDDGFVYTATGNWKIGETWNTMVLASSYYQPSERQYGSESRVDAFSWGLAKVMVRGKLRSTLDLRYRRETHNYAFASESSNDYVLDIWTGRLGLDYTLNRFLGAFAYAEYQKSMNNEAESRNNAYDYDRWRVSLGIRVSY